MFNSSESKRKILLSKYHENIGAIFFFFENGTCVTFIINMLMHGKCFIVKDVIVGISNGKIIQRYNPKEH